MNKPAALKAIKSCPARISLQVLSNNFTVSDDEELFVNIRDEVPVEELSRECSTSIFSDDSDFSDSEASFDSYSNCITASFSDGDLTDTDPNFSSEEDDEGFGP